MNMRSTRSTVTFSNPFTLSGYPDKLPAGDYEVVIEEELLHGLSFEAYRRTGAYLVVRGSGNRAGRSEMRLLSESDLRMALSQIPAPAQNNTDSEAALSPQEDMK